MAVRCEAIGLKRLCLGAFAALYLAGTHSAHAGDTSDATSNPWGDSLLKYNIPYIHGNFSGTAACVCCSALVAGPPLAAVTAVLFLIGFPCWCLLVCYCC